MTMEKDTATSAHDNAGLPRRFAPCNDDKLSEDFGFLRLEFFFG